MVEDAGEAGLEFKSAGVQLRDLWGAGAAEIAQGSVRREDESGARGTVNGRQGEGHGQDAHATFCEIVCVKKRRRNGASFLCP